MKFGKTLPEYRMKCWRKMDIPIYVDHRTLKAQRETAEEAGDEFLSKLYKRVPEEYVGILPAQEENEISAGGKQYRKNVQEKQHELFQADVQRKIAEEFETKILVRQAEHAGFELINSSAYKSANLEEESIRFLNQGMLLGLARIKEVKQYLVGVSRARELAKKQYLTPEERKCILAYKNAQGQECNLRRLLRELRELPETYKESQEEFLEIRRAMEKKIRELRIFLSRGHAQLCEIEEKLNRPYVRKNVELVVHGILQRNQEVLSELKKASESVLRNAEILSSKLEVREMPQTPKTTFTAKEVRNSLSRQYRSLKEEHEEMAIKRFQLMMKRVTAKEALEKAKNIFVDGGFKKLSVEQQAYKKALANYEREKSEYQEREMIFKRTKWANSAEKFQAQYYLTKEKIRLEEIGQKLSATNIRLARESARLENLWQTEKAREKIALIAVNGINLTKKGKDFMIVPKGLL